MKEDPSREKVKKAYRNSFQDPRDNWRYMLSKVLTDYRLLGIVFSKERISRMLNIGISFPVDEILFARKVLQKWIGLDFVPEVLLRAKGLIKDEKFSNVISFVGGDVTALPFSDNSFDLVVAFSTIDHIPSHRDRIKAIYEITRCLRPNGYAIITVPNRWNLAYAKQSRICQQSGEISCGFEYCFSPLELKKMLVLSGLKPIKFVSTLSIYGIDTGRIARILDLMGKFLGYFGRRMGFLAYKYPIENR